MGDAVSMGGWGGGWLLRGEWDRDVEVRVRYAAEVGIIEANQIIHLFI